MHAARDHRGFGATFIEIDPGILKNLADVQSVGGGDSGEIRIELEGKGHPEALKSLTEREIRRDRETWQVDVQPLR